jgi:peptide/nickel transport system substrate-binding protein
MESAMKLRPVLAVAATVAAVAALSGCASTGSSSSGANALVVGTTDKLTALDPAGSWDTGSYTVQDQVFGWLLTSKPGKSTPEPDLAKSAGFTSPTQYTVTLRKGLHFANGHALTASDVVFSFDRMVKIASPDGPSSLLADMASVKATGKDTVVFTLHTADDKLWPQVLTSPAAPIVDEQSFSATKLTADQAIVKADAFDGQYKISSYKANSLVGFKRNDDYDGILGKAKTENVDLQYETDETTLKLAVQKGDVDVAYHQLAPTDIASLKKNSSVKVYSGPGASMRFIVFDMKTMPFGSSTSTPDSAKALAVRKAAADLIDRDAIAKQVYDGTYSAAYSQVPSSLPGAKAVYKSAYGNGSGGASLSKATAVLKAAGITTPVTLHLQYNTDHYGASSADEYALVQSQLQAGGLFKVSIQSTEWTTYTTQFVKDQYPAYQLGWSADYPDSDNYLNLLYGTSAAPSLLGAASENSTLNKLIDKERTMADGSARDAVLEKAQDVTAQYVPTIPLLQGTETVVAGKDVTGVQSTLDASFRFRFGSLGR